MAEPLRRRVRARLLRGLGAGAGWLPEPLLRGGLGLAGSSVRHSKYGQRARRNLELALPASTPEERELILRGCFRHAARQLEEWIRLSRGASLAWLDDAVTVDPSMQILDAELEKGRGAIVVTPHLGNWELLAATLRRRGVNGAVVGLKRPRDSSFDWLVEMRRAYGVETIPQDSNPRRLLEVLQSGGVLGLLPDLEVRRLGGEFVPFFGRPALTMTAPAAFARARRSPLIPVRCVARKVARKGERGEYVLSVHEPLELPVGMPRKEATIELTRQLNALFESWIRETPEQWAWHQDRWRTAPGDYDVVPLVERHRRKRLELEGESRT